MAEKKHVFGPGEASKNARALVMIQVDGKVGAGRPAVFGFPEHGISTQVIEAVFCIGKEEHGGGLRGVW